MKSLKCPTCGETNLIQGVRDLPYTYKGETTILSAVSGDYCTACDESILGAEESKRTMSLMKVFNKQVNAA